MKNSGTSPKTDAVTDLDFNNLKWRLEKTANVTFIMKTGSMHPVIRAGDRVLITVPKFPLRRFDIIVFKNTNFLICHYVWHQNSLGFFEAENTYVTRDMKLTEDVPVAVSSILGLVISHRIPKRKRLYLLLKSLWMRH